VFENSAVKKILCLRERKKQGLEKYCKGAARFEILTKQNWGV